MPECLVFLLPFLLVLNFCFFSFFGSFFKKIKYAIIPLAALFFSWNIYASIFALHIFNKQSFETNLNQINVMSYNVRLLNLYKWNKDTNTRRKIIEMFAEQNPTVLCLQEFYNGNDSIGVNNIQDIMDACQYKYFATCDINTTKRGKWGCVVFSHLPIVKMQNHDIDVYGNNLLQQVDILLKNETIHLFNVHLKSNRFTSNESDAIMNIEKVQLKENSIHIFKKTEKERNRSRIRSCFSF
ncbi:MAG: endonuclease/exonuclease/phosphatase [Bacteroidetes bacterium OLB11]|nr:MAG: endonuclease/exonuclease/phosphatase [Bacteroidetes bacterium OLB11]